MADPALIALIAARSSQPVPSSSDSSASGSASDTQAVTPHALAGYGHLRLSRHVGG